MLNTLISRGASFARQIGVLDRARLDKLVSQIDGAVSGPTRDFLRAYDVARLRFERSLRGKDAGVLAEVLLAVKCLNLLINKHEYLHQRIAKAGRPIGFMLDPANSCQLGCPSCMNSFNREAAEKTFNAWPKVIMKDDIFESFIHDVGLGAFHGHFYNNHEPFINKKTPNYVRRAGDFRVDTFISSNLSHPKLDAEAIVASGLKELMCAIDGVTQDVYERYRRGGQLDLVFHNAAEIVAAKKRLGSQTPIMRWQMLMFQHNVHQVDDSMEKARELGFNTFNVATPFEVSQDDPTISGAVYDGPDEKRQITLHPFGPIVWNNDLSALGDAIFSRLSESAEARATGVDGYFDEVPAPSGDHCDWLHLAVISDATGRIVPCCLGDYKDWPGTFEFADVKHDAGQLMNSYNYRAARRFMAAPQDYDGPAVRCQSCMSRPRPQIGLSAAESYLMSSAVEPDCRASLTNWSRHSEQKTPSAMK